MSFAFAFLGPDSVEAQTLVADTFQGATFNPNVAQLANYQLNGQSGTLSPLPYLTNVPSEPSKLTVPTTAGNTYVGTVTNSNQGQTNFGYATNFEYGQMSISVDIAPGNSLLGRLILGAGNPAGGGAAGAGFFVQVSNDSVSVLPYGGASTPIIFTGVANTGMNFNTVRVDFTTNPAYNGAGATTLNVWINDVQLDLNGASSGMSWVRDGSVNALNTAFTNNYVWFGSVGRDSSLQSSYFDNISIETVPEPSTFALLIGVGGVLVARRRSGRGCLA